MTKKTLKCKRCGHFVGTVRIKPAFNRKLVMYGFAAALAMQVVADAVSGVLFYLWQNA